MKRKQLIRERSLSDCFGRGHDEYRWLAREGYHYLTRFDPQGRFEIHITR